MLLTAYVTAGEFLYSCYPGILKMRIKNWDFHGTKGVFIKLYSHGEKRRCIYSWGYKVETVVAGLITRIKADMELSERFKHPEPYTEIGE